MTSNPGWQQDADYQQCMAAHAECDTSSSTAFSDDYCTEVFMLNDLGRQGFVACFQKPCVEISTCLRAALQIP